MNCADLRLDERMDGELDAPAAAEVERHLASCAECRAELDRSRRLEALLQKAVPSGAVPDTDRFLQGVQSRSRRSGGWMFAVAAVLLAGIVAVVASSLGGGTVDVRRELARYAQKSDAGEAEARIRSAGPAAIPDRKSVV